MNTTIFPPAFLQLFKDNQNFLILGHQEPDGDCIGSQLALSQFLTRMGKKCKLFSQGPFKREEINAFAPLFKDTIEGFDKIDNPLAVVLDCSTLDRLGSLAEGLGGLKIAVIDHHTSGDPFGDWRIINSKAPSTTMLVYQLIKALGEKPQKSEADPLFLGLATDTGFFRHLESGSGSAFEMAGELVDLGVSPKASFSQIHGGKNLGNFQLMGLILSRTESFWDNQVLFSSELASDRERFHAENRESDQIYQALQSVRNNDVVILLREESPGKITGGLRSKKIVDVGTVAKNLGGGGHFHASGFAAAGTLLEVKEKLLTEIKKLLEKS